MREILFRGKRVDTGEWVFGMAWIFIEKTMICPWHEGMCKYDTGYFPVQVIAKTFGQYTGLTDRNDKRIFEGDIVTGLFLFGLSVNAVVTFQNGAFGLEWYRSDIKTFNAFPSICNVEYEVIGNVTDNPGLLKGE